MTPKEKLKQAINEADESTIAILNSVLMALQTSSNAYSSQGFDWKNHNPLKNTVIYERDLISPIEEVWEVDT